MKRENKFTPIEPSTMQPRNPYANVSYVDAMRGVEGYKLARRADSSAWSPRWHYAGTAALVCVVALMAFRNGIEHAPVRVVTRVEQPKLYVQAPPPYCEPTGNAYAPETNEAAAATLDDGSLLPYSNNPKVLATQITAAAKLEAQRMKVQGDLERERIKALEKRREIQLKLLSGPGKQSSVEPPARRSSGPKSRGTSTRKRDVAALESPRRGPREVQISTGGKPRFY